jgi:ElaB/YqjD/DUF883 family membrane-anchored ribosome-binding protein
MNDSNFIERETTMDTTHKTSEQGMTSGGSSESGRAGYGVKEAKTTEPGAGAETGFVETASKIADQAKAAVSQAYDGASKGLNRTYEQAKEYSREATEGLNRGIEQAKEYGRQKPVNAALIAFGVGVGFGLLFAGAFRTRSGNRRFVRPVMNALTEIAAEIF